MFWENFLALCNQFNETPNGVAKKLGFSTGTVTWWKKGRHPRDIALNKIAQYFDVSVEYLLTGKEKTPDAKPSVILDAMGLHLTPEEVQIILSYRSHPELQPVVRKLLDIPENTEKDTNAVS